MKSEDKKKWMAELEDDGNGSNPIKIQALE